LASLQVFLSPQEQAQLVAAKEDADATIEQSRITLRLIGDQLERYRTAKESISGARLVELQELHEKAQAALREAQEKLPFLPAEPYPPQLGLKPVEISNPLAGRNHRRARCSAAVRRRGRSALDGFRLVATVVAGAGVRGRSAAARRQRSGGVHRAGESQAANGVARRRSDDDRCDTADDRSVLPGRKRRG